MQSYIGSKIIKAEPMTDLDFEVEKYVFESAKGAVKAYQSGVNLLVRSHSKDGISIREHREPKEGYKVMYPDGYNSWSPKHVFEEAYRLISNSEKDLIK